MQYGTERKEGFRLNFEKISQVSENSDVDEDVQNAEESL
jgi:hypothetical protein